MRCLAFQRASFTAHALLRPDKAEADSFVRISHSPWSPGKNDRASERLARLMVVPFSVILCRHADTFDAGPTGPGAHPAIVQLTFTPSKMEKLVGRKDRQDVELRPALDSETLDTD